MKLLPGPVKYAWLNYFKGKTNKKKDFRLIKKHRMGSYQATLVFITGN